MNIPATIPALLAQQAQALDKIFLYFGDLEISYKALHLLTNRLAHGLANLGFKSGDKLCLMLPNCAEYVYLFLGTPKLGLTIVPINTALKQDEINYIAANSDARAIVVSPQFLPLAQSLLSASDNVREIILVGKLEVNGEGQGVAVANSTGAMETTATKGSITKGSMETEDSAAKENGTTIVPFDELLIADESDIDHATPDAIVSIVYTSGTTGKPKGVMLTNANYMHNSAQAREGLGMFRDDRAMCILPLFHVNGQVATVLTPLQSGASLILTEGFSPKTFFHNLSHYRATLFSGVPTVYSILLHLPERDKYDLSSLRLCICGAAPMPVELFHQFETAFHTIIIEGYGLSEGTCVSTLNPVDGQRKIGSIGLPLNGQEIKIFNDQDQEVGIDEIGEIVVRGENVMLGYYKNETASAETLRNGWLHTGDLGKKDEQGYIYIVGRKKEMIIRGGENIYPKEIEEVLYCHPMIREAAVIGMPDKVWGEEVTAAIVLKDGVNLSADEVMRYCRDHLADFKCPRQVYFCQQFPKTATGKVQKSKLVTELQN